MKKDFLLEMGCEEMPADSLVLLSKELQASLEKELADVQLSHQGVQSFVTPRRLAIFISGLDAEQPSRRIEKLGPTLEAAYDKEGNPTLSCLGFARSCGVSVDQLNVKESAKDKRLYCVVDQPGLQTIKVLPAMVMNGIKKISNLQSMRWGNHEVFFIRPVHWVVMLFGEQIIDAEILGIKAGRDTYGHRFLSPQKISLKEANNYSSLLADNFVLPEFNQRKEKIREQISQTVDSTDHAIIDESLLNEVTGLVEWPIALQGQFDKKFLKVPAEVLMTSMQTHQRCFPVKNNAKQLQPYFIIISNIISKDPAVVIKGNERVINARLSDAEFFYEKDLQHSLENRLPRLSGVVFQQKLGSMAEKTDRLIKLSAIIAQSLNINAETAKRAAQLAKCDLVSDMVFEFPNLQGTMGYYYALHDQETAECALAIRDQYYPRFAKDQLPESLYGATLALADRLDTLIGIFGIFQAPTGEKDPFALRRAALGILRILVEKELPLDLMELLTAAKAAYEIHLPNTEVVDETFNFIMGRFRSWYQEQGVSVEVFESVLARRPTSPFDFARRIKAVLEFQNLPEAQALAAANKRVSNILKKIDLQSLPAIQPGLFEYEEEKNLAKLLDEYSQKLNQSYTQGAYTQGLTQLSHLKEPIDRFFDRVMVMVDDEKIRNNRLALLVSLRQLFTQVADISLL